MSMRQRLRRILHQYKCCICSSSQHFCRRLIAGRWNASVFAWWDACDQSTGVLRFDNLPAVVRDQVCYVSDSNSTAQLSPVPQLGCGGVGVVSVYKCTQPGWPGKKGCLLRLLQSATGQELLAPSYWTLNTACCNIGKRARGLNGVGRRKGGQVSELPQTGVRGKRHCCFDEGESHSWSIS